MHAGYLSLLIGFPLCQPWLPSLYLSSMTTISLASGNMIFSWACVGYYPPQGVRNQSSQAPTWSWASVEGSTSISFVHRLYLCKTSVHHHQPSKVLEANVYISGASSTGPVSGGFVRIFGPLCEAELVISGRSPDVLKSPLRERYRLCRKDDQNSTLTYKSDEFDELNFDTQIESTLATWPRGGFYTTLQRASGDKLQAEGPLKGNVFCLLMAEYLEWGSAVGRVFLVLGVSPRVNDEIESQTDDEAIFSRIAILLVSSRYEESKSWFEDMDKGTVRIE
jgi:hypothetical protein